MKKARLFKNSFSAIAQVVVTGGVYFILYAYLLQVLGVKLLGVWSLIIASTSLALIANFGISTSIVKFVSTYSSREDFVGLRKLIFTSLSFILFAYVVIAILLYFMAPLLLPEFIEEKYLGVSLEILPFSLISLVINALGGVLSGSLDGLQKNYIRSVIMSLSTLVLLFLSVALTPSYGLKGLVWAQIIQGLLVLVSSMFVVSRFIPGAFSLQWNWSRVIFKEVMTYGLKMQSLSLMQMSFEPITKAFLSKFGGLAMVGYYEMANRLVSQLRSIIVSGNQVVIPLVAEAKEKDETFIKELYVRSFSIILFLNIILMTCIIVSIPLISKLWIGGTEPFFDYSVILSTLAVFVNISSNPAYFSYMGEGKLNWLVYSYMGVTVVNITGGYFLGISYGGYGVVAAWNFAFLTGSLIIMTSYHNSSGINFPTLIDRNTVKLMISSALLCTCAYEFQMQLISGQFSTAWLIGFVVSGGFFVKFAISNANFVLIWSQIQNYLPFKKRQNL